MVRHRLAALTLLMMLVGVTSSASGQGRPDPAVLIAAQREAMRPLAIMDGVWRGPASITMPSGETHTVTQTERVGPFLDGSIKVMEGRGYDADGKVAFNAFGTISYNPATRVYTMHSHAQGHVGDFVLTLTPTADGFRLGNPGRADDDPLYGHHQGRCVAGSRRPDRARQGAGPLLRDESQACGRFQLARCWGNHSYVSMFTQHGRLSLR
jgi:hypothetical protein